LAAQTSPGREGRFRSIVGRTAHWRRISVWHPSHVPFKFSLRTLFADVLTSCFMTCCWHWLLGLWKRPCTLLAYRAFNLSAGVCPVPSPEKNRYQVSLSRQIPASDLAWSG